MLICPLLEVPYINGKQGEGDGTLTLGCSPLGFFDRVDNVKIKRGGGYARPESATVSR